MSVLPAFALAAVGAATCLWARRHDRLLVDAVAYAVLFAASLFIASYRP